MKGQLEAQVRPLSENLAAEKELADNAEKEMLLQQTKRSRGQRLQPARDWEMDQECNGFTPYFKLCFVTGHHHNVCFKWVEFEQFQTIFPPVTKSLLSAEKAETGVQSKAG